MKYAFYPGCYIPTRYPGFEAATREVLRLLEVDLTDLDFSCCPPTTNVRLVNYDTWLTMAARNLCLAEEAGLGIVTTCNGCAASLTEANLTLRTKAGQRRKVNQVLKEIGRRYQGQAEILHVLRLIHREIGLDPIKDLVVRPLKGIRFAAHYGCHYYRPPRIMFPQELSAADSYVPRSLDRILEVLGAEPVQYSRKFLCCGSVLGANIGGDETYGVVLEKLGHMADRKVEAIVLPCGSCFTQFEMGQVVARRKHKIKYDLPVFYFTELMALAFGLDPKKLGLTEHTIKTKALLERVL